MTQLEQELQALFHDATERLDIRPLPARLPRRATVNRALAAGLAAAVVAALVVVATRFGSDAANRGGAVTPAATQRLVDAVARTMAEPLRIDETTKARVPGGAPDSGPDSSVIELDASRHELRITRGGQPSYLLVNKHLYIAIPELERQATGNSAARWQEAPLPPDAEESLYGAGSTGLFALQKALETGQATVEDLGGRRYHVAVDLGPDQHTAVDSADIQRLDEIVHLSPDGYVDRLRTTFQVTAGTPAVLVETARISLLHRSLRLHEPDPATVLDQSYLQPSGTATVQACPTPSSSPSGSAAYSSQTQCFMEQAVPLTVHSGGKAKRGSRR